MHRGRFCAALIVLSALGGAGGGAGFVWLTQTPELSLDEAIERTRAKLTPQQKDLVAAALRRHGMSIILSLELLGSDYSTESLKALSERLKNYVPDHR